MPDPSPPSRRTTRRRFLKAGGVAGLLVAAGAAVAIVRSSGYDVPKDLAAKLVALAPWQLVLAQHVSRRIAAPDRPGVPTADDVDVAGFIDGYVARMDAALRKDLLRLFAYVEHVAPLASGFASRFTRLGPEDQDAVLAALEASSNDLLRGGFDGLKSLVFMGYYRDARTWSILGYDGPLVGRPKDGWTR